jgi:hypothetical protein
VQVVGHDLRQPEQLESADILVAGEQRCSDNSL